MALHGGEHGVELGHAGGVELRGVARDVGAADVALVVVVADGVVAESCESGGEDFALLGGDVMGAEAEVDAVEALRDAGLALEFEVGAVGDGVAVLAGGGVEADDVREVERGALLDFE